MKRNQVLIELCGSLPPVALVQYSRKCLIDEIVLTNKIEGIHSSRKEIGDALTLLETQAREKGNTKYYSICMSVFDEKMFKEGIAETDSEPLHRPAHH